MQSMGAPVYMQFVKPVGSANSHMLCDREDVVRLRELGKKYNADSHLTPHYELNVGCLAVKRLVAILASGEVMPCAWTFMSMGNVCDEPLAEILDKGMRYYGKNVHHCRLLESEKFRANAVPALTGDALPLMENVMRPGDADC